MKVIGITGGTGGGKTSALRALQALGVPTIDCDEVYHRLLEESGDMIGELKAHFPAAFTDNVFDRKALGRIVFGDGARLLELNEITHKYVTRETRVLLDKWRADGMQAAAIDAIALIESGIGDMCDVIVGVTAPEEVRAMRIAARDGVTEEYARLRIRAQKPDSFFAENCDHMLISDCDTVEEFENKCKSFFTEILGG